MSNNDLLVGLTYALPTLPSLQRHSYDPFSRVCTGKLPSAQRILRQGSTVTVVNSLGGVVVVTGVIVTGTMELTVVTLTFSPSGVGVCVVTSSSDLKSKSSPES